MIRYSLLLLFLSSISALGQIHKPNFKIGFHGYVGVDVMRDSRASKSVRHRHIYLYPLNERVNDEGEDLNRRGEFDIDAAHSRFGIDLWSAEINGLKTDAMIEADFQGESPGNSFFRLRHAFIRFSKARWSLLAGQYWHPFCQPEGSAGTINANAGAPFHPLNRSPQLRFMWEAARGMRLLLFLVEQNNFRSTGFPKGSEEAGMPEVDCQVQWLSPLCWVALTGGVKSLAIPESLEPVVPAKVVRSYHFNAALKRSLSHCSLRMGATYGGNLSELVMLGGVGKSEDNDYLPLQTFAFWGSVQGLRKQGWQPGCFAGFTQNVGASSPVSVLQELSREPGIAYIYAVSPRVRYLFDHVVLGAEWLWTTAGWGKTFDRYGVPESVSAYTNHRLLLSLRYKF